MAKTRFKTKLTKKQKRNNILVILAVVVFLYAFTLLFSFGIGLFTDWTNPETYFIVLLGFLLVSSMLVFPFIIVGAVLGVQRGKAKRVRDDSTFVSVQDLDYYRDNLSGLSPAIASLLIDLDIYGKKDVAATLLGMQKKGVVYFNDKGRIIETAKTKKGLDDGERELLKIIKSGKLSNKDLLQWRRNRFYDALKLGYIKKKTGISNEPKAKPALLSILSFACGFVVWGWFINSFNPGMPLRSAIAVLQVVGVLVVIDILFCMPIYLLTRWAAYNKRFKMVAWERTKLGNETAEKIFGLARFIHEFSLLSEAKKEQVALWDDYLVYAIVLEENEQIVKDISRLFKLNSRGFKKLHERHT